jgi:MFS family permease
VSLDHRELPVTVLRYRDYRLIWGAEFVSNIGTEMHAVALSWQVFQITGSIALLGVLGLVRAIALMSTSLLGGLFADTRDRRKVLLVTQSILMLLSVLLAVTTWAEAVDVWLLYAVAVGVAITSAFDSPAQQALIPNLVPRERIPDAMSLNIITWNVAAIAGPALGGISVATLGVGGTYALDSITFIAVIAAILAMRARPVTPPLARAGWAAIKDGFRFIWATPIIAGVMLLDFLATLLGSSVGLAPVFAEEVLKVGAQGYGFMVSAVAVGAVVGATGMSVLPAPRRPGILILAAVAAYGGSLVLFGLASSLWMALLALALAGGFDALSMTMRHTIRNLATPDELRGRISATHSLFAAGGPRLGQFQSAMTASLVGPRLAMVFGGVGCVAIAGLLALAIPAIRRFTLPASRPVAASSDDD